MPGGKPREALSAAPLCAVGRAPVLWTTGCLLQAILSASREDQGTWSPTGEPMNPKQLQSLAVLALAMVPVALLWWVWVRMLD